MENNPLKIFHPVPINTTEVAWTTYLCRITAAGVRFEEKHKADRRFLPWESAWVCGGPAHLEVNRMPTTTFSESNRFAFRRDILWRSDGDPSSELVTELCGKDMCFTENSSNSRTKIKKCWLFPVLFILSAVSGRIHCENREVITEDNAFVEIRLCQFLNITFLLF